MRVLILCGVFILSAKNVVPSQVKVSKFCIKLNIPVLKVNMALGNAIYCSIFKGMTTAQ